MNSIEERKQKMLDHFQRQVDDLKVKGEDWVLRPGLRGHVFLELNQKAGEYITPDNCHDIKLLTEQVRAKYQEEVADTLEMLEKCGF